MPKISKREIMRRKARAQQMGWGALAESMLQHACRLCPEDSRKGAHLMLFAAALLAPDKDEFLRAAAAMWDELDPRQNAA